MELCAQWGAVAAGLEVARMSKETLALVLIVVGLVLIVVQAILLIVTAVKAKKAEDDSKSGASTQSIGDILAPLLKALVASVPLGVLGVVLILIGGAIGGFYDPSVWFPAPTPTPTEG